MWRHPQQDGGPAMTFFGIKLFDDIDLPEFPFPDLGPLDDADDPAPPSARVPRSRATATDAGGAHRARLDRRYH
jgi:hypothetical protein